MKKEKKWLFMIASLVLVGICITFIAGIIQRNNRKRQFEEQMDLGNRYLSEENYEAAVVAFNKAIEIAPKNVESYSKAAQAYAGMGDYEEAIQVLEKGSQNTGDEGLKQEKEDYERYYSLLPIVQKLMAFFQQEDKIMLWNYMSGDEYQDATLNLKQRFEYQDRNGKYLLIYPCGHSYYGDMEAGERSGYGIWASYRYNWSTGDFFQGMWKDDYPNGMGVYSWLHSGNTSISKGNFKDGYEDGDMVETFSYSEDIGYHHSDNGIPGRTRYEREGHIYMWGGPIISSVDNKEFVEKVGISHARKDEDTSMRTRTSKTGPLPFFP